MEEKREGDGKGKALRKLALIQALVSVENEDGRGEA